MISFPFIFIALATGFHHEMVSAARVRMEGRSNVGGGMRLSRRAVGEGLSNRNDLSYFANITIGGIMIESNIDTGRYVTDL
jgi:hypothetical protein